MGDSWINAKIFSFRSRVVLEGEWDRNPLCSTCSLTTVLPPFIPFTSRRFNGAFPGSIIKHTHAFKFRTFVPCMFFLIFSKISQNKDVHNMPLKSQNFHYRSFIWLDGHGHRLWTQKYYFRRFSKVLNVVKKLFLSFSSGCADPYILEFSYFRARKSWISVYFHC